MDYRSILRDHIESQIKRKLEPSFSYLSQKEKRELATYELASSPDGWDMLYNHDGIPLPQLIFNCVVKKTCSGNQAIEILLDDLVKRYSPALSEKFDEELEKYQEEQDINFSIIRSCQEIGDSNAFLRV